LRLGRTVEELLDEESGVSYAELCRWQDFARRHPKAFFPSGCAWG
jgi:hypothetical protein